MKKTSSKPPPSSQSLETCIYAYIHIYASIWMQYSQHHFSHPTNTELSKHLEQPWGAPPNSVVLTCYPKKSAEITWEKSRVKPLLVGGWTNPSEKYQSNWKSSPKRGENKNYLKPRLYIEEGPMILRVDDILFQLLIRLTNTQLVG